MIATRTATTSPISERGAPAECRSCSCVCQSAARAPGINPPMVGSLTLHRGRCIRTSWNEHRSTSVARKPPHSTGKPTARADPVAPDPRGDRSGISQRTSVDDVLAALEASSGSWADHPESGEEYVDRIRPGPAVRTMGRSLDREQQRMRLVLDSSVVIDQLRGHPGATSLIEDRVRSGDQLWESLSRGRRSAGMWPAEREATMRLLDVMSCWTSTSTWRTTQLR